MAHIKQVSLQAPAKHYILEADVLDGDRVYCYMTHGIDPYPMGLQEKIAGAFVTMGLSAKLVGDEIGACGLLTDWHGTRTLLALLQAFMTFAGPEDLCISVDVRVGPSTVTFFSSSNNQYWQVKDKLQADNLEDLVRTLTQRKLARAWVWRGNRAELRFMPYEDLCTNLVRIATTVLTT